MPDNPLSHASGVVLIDDPNWLWQGRQKREKVKGDLNPAIDRSVRQGGYWRTGTFTVPAETTEERVQLVGHKYLIKYGDRLVAEGLTVHRMVGPMLDRRPRPVEPDRRRYIIYSFVSCRPFEPIYDIPDKFVPDMLKAGLRLLE